MPSLAGLVNMVDLVEVNPELGSQIEEEQTSKAAVISSALLLEKQEWGTYPRITSYRQSRDVWLWVSQGLGTHLGNNNNNNNNNTGDLYCAHIHPAGYSRRESRNTGASPFSFTISVLGSFTCITQHTGPTALRPIRRTKQLWLSVLLKDISTMTKPCRYSNPHSDNTRTWVQCTRAATTLHGVTTVRSSRVQ